MIGVPADALYDLAKGIASLRVRVACIIAVVVRPFLCVRLAFCMLKL
jgi:hypothetical protein